MSTPPPPTPSPEGQPPSGSTLGLDPKVAGLLAYLFGWVSGLIIYLTEKEHREVRFHAAQSILVSLAIIAVYIVLSVIAMVPVIGLIALLGYLVVGLGGFALWVYLLIQGYNLNHVTLPVIGKMAEEWAAK